MARQARLRSTQRPVRGPRPGALERQVAGLLAGRGTAPVVLARVLRVLGRSLGFRVGRIVALAPDGLLRTIARWQIPQLRRALAAAPSATAPPGTRVPGLALAIERDAQAFACIELSVRDAGAHFVTHTSIPERIVSMLAAFLDAHLAPGAMTPPEAGRRVVGAFDLDLAADTARLRPEMLELLGLRDATGRRPARVLRDLMHAGDAVRFDALLATHLADGSPVDLPCRLQAAAGLQSFRVRAHAVLGSDGRPLRVFGSIVRRGRPPLVASGDARAREGETDRPAAGSGVTGAKPGASGADIVTLADQVLAHAQPAGAPRARVQVAPELPPAGDWQMLRSVLILLAAAGWHRMGATRAIRLAGEADRYAPCWRLDFDPPSAPCSTAIAHGGGGEAALEAAIRLLRRRGGDLQMEGDSVRGVTFRFTLPDARPTCIADAPASPPVAA